MFTRETASLFVHTEADSYSHPGIFLPQQVHTWLTQQVHKDELKSQAHEW